MDLVSQNLLMTSGGKKDPVYLDDVFSTYLYKGNGAAQEINNGIKLSNNNAGNGINFDKSGDYLSLGSSSDFTMGTGDFTVECWVYMRSVSVGIINGFWQISSTSGGLQTSSYGDTLAVAWDNTVGWQTYGAGTWTASMSPAAATNTWYHTAYVRSSGTSKLYINGTAVISQADTNNYNGTYMAIGGYYSTNYLMGGVISNLRVVKGTAVYTGNFTPPTKELTSITNTKLLCCNNSVITTATVTPTGITVNGDPNASFGPFTTSDGEGGMVWTKSRSSNGHIVTDTVRGAGKGLVPNSNDASSNNLLELSSFNNSGFSIGNNYIINTDAESYASWTWRINKGFFDVVQYTGNGSAGHQVAHSLGCEVGFMMVKRLENAANWSCYHRDAQTSGAYLLTLNSTGGSGAVTDIWNNTAPTSTHFTLGTSANTNGNGETYICYLFAGGANTAATARSVDFDGSGDYLSLSPSSDFAFGTGDYTVECWIKPKVLPTAGYLHIIFNTGGADNNTFFFHISKNQISVGNQNAYISNQPFTNFENGNWYHIAACRSGTTLRLFVNGVQAGSNATDNINWLSEGTNVKIGTDDGFNQTFNGKISNFRVVKGTALYTSSFRPPYEPLTNITNTKLLCCNNSSTTGSTVTPGTITANGNPTASTDSPFDDPAGFVFGESGSENVIKCGSYVGSGSATHKKIELGFEPQWIMIKRVTGGTSSWTMADMMRGTPADDGNSSQNGPFLWANQNWAEATDRPFTTHSTGFGLKNTSSRNYGELVAVIVSHV